MTHPDEDELWRSIVENYGERAQLDDDLAPENEGRRPAVPDEPATPSALAPYEATGLDEVLGGPAEVEDEARFVPPPPPPLPRTTPLRRSAWIGVFGAPIAFLATAFTGGSLGGALALAIAAIFVASLVYLVVTMPQDPPDPGDDGARV